MGEAEARLVGPVGCTSVTWLDSPGLAAAIRTGFAPGDRAGLTAAEFAASSDPRVAAAVASMAAHRDLLALLLVWEIGKPWRLACADVDRALDGVRWYVEEIDRQVSGRDPLLRGLGVYHGKRGWGVSVEFDVQAGPVTLLGLGQDRDGSLAFVASEGTVVPGPLLAIGNTTSRVDFGRDPGENHQREKRAEIAL